MVKAVERGNPMNLKINSRISMILTEDGFTSSNAVLVEDNERLMIDSGCGSVLAGVHPETVDVLLNSHHHIDHIKGNNSFTRAKIYAHPLEKEAMKNPAKTRAAEGWYELMGDNIADHVAELGSIPAGFLGPWHIDETFRDNDIIRCGNTEIIVIETPGHTAGHCSFLFPEENFIFTADICLTRVGPWYGDPDATTEDFIRSVDRIIKLKPAKLATGHLMQIITEGIPETLTGYRDRIFRREERILHYLKDNIASINDMAEKKFIYPGHPTSFVLFWEKAMLKKHLDSLLSKGLVIRTENGKFTAV